MVLLVHVSGIATFVRKPVPFRTRREPRVTNPECHHCVVVRQDPVVRLAKLARLGVDDIPSVVDNRQGRERAVVLLLAPAGGSALIEPMRALT